MKLGQYLRTIARSRDVFRYVLVNPKLKIDSYMESLDDDKYVFFQYFRHLALVTKI